MTQRDANRWTPEMDQLLLFMIQMLGTTHSWCAAVMSREYPHREITTRAVTARSWRLRERGTRYAYDAADFTD